MILYLLLHKLLYFDFVLNSQTVNKAYRIFSAIGIKSIYENKY